MSLLVRFSFKDFEIFTMFCAWKKKEDEKEIFYINNEIPQLLS